MRLKPSLHQPAYRWLRSTTGHYRPCSPPMRVRRRVRSNWNRIRRTDLIHHRSTTKLWRLSPWPITPAVHQVNLPFSYYRSKGTASLPLETRSHRTTCERREFLRSLANWKKKHNLCLFLYTSLPHRRNRKDRRQAYSLFL